MTDTEDRLQVSFPASETFTRIGRVAVAGLALRLGLDISVVENLRLAVDTAVASLHGPGRIHVQATWASDELLVLLNNPEATITDQSALANDLAGMVNRVSVEQNNVTLAVASRSI